MTDEFEQIMSRYLWDESCGYSAYGVEDLSEWLATDIVRMIELMDAELQQRGTDAEQDLYGPDGHHDWNPEDEDV